MRIEPTLLDELIAHAREEYDAECCGLIAYAHSDGDGDGDGYGDRDGDGDRAAGSDGAHAPRAVRVHRAQNVFDTDRRSASKRFEIDGREVLRTLDEFEREGWELGAIYHSHTHTEPYPSQTDINFAANWPGLEWVIVGLADAQPEVRCFQIEGGVVREVALEVA